MTSQHASGELIGIAIRSKSRAEMIEHDHLDVSTEAGLEGDFRGKPGKRQVTVMAIEDWQAACDELDLDEPLGWTTRRANLLVRGVALAEKTGSVLAIGDTRLKITGETDPCGRMDESQPGLMKALTPDWRGGVCCTVLSGGAVKVGEPVTLEADAT
ncbi:MAG: MOSC domain-containing protein [Planctomycetota bacterium]